PVCRAPPARARPPVGGGRGDADRPRRDGLPDARRAGGPRAGLPRRPGALLRGRAARTGRAPSELGPVVAAARRRPRPSFAIGSVRVRAGSRQEVSLPISRLVTGAEVSLPVHVLHGREDGPTVWLDA